jgi:hypothetical protein
VHIACDEPCRLRRALRPDGRDTVAIADSMLVAGSFDGYIMAIDSAGNSQLSPRLSYSIDTSVIGIAISPAEGIYNRDISISIQPTQPALIYYSFDPTAPRERFLKYSAPVSLPYGLTLVRYYGSGGAGRETDIRNATFVIDTVPPKIRADHLYGRWSDTLVLTTKKPAQIRYCIGEACRLEGAAVYTQPLPIAHEGRFSCGRRPGTRPAMSRRFSPGS